MQLSEILRPENIRLKVAASGKGELLRKLCKAAADATGLEAADVEALISQRESLGSTGVGLGVALPHARVQGLERPFLLLTTLAKPVKYDAIDDEPVELVAFLLMPQGNGKELNALACVSRTLRSPAIRGRLKTAGTPEDAMAILCDPGTTGS